jgi:hypothetical protein
MASNSHVYDNRHFNDLACYMKEIMNAQDSFYETSKFIKLSIPFSHHREFSVETTNPDGSTQLFILLPTICDENVLPMNSDGSVSINPSSYIVQIHPTNRLSYVPFFIFVPSNTKYEDAKLNYFFQMKKLGALPKGMEARVEAEEKRSSKKQKKATQLEQQQERIKKAKSELGRLKREAESARQSKVIIIKEEHLEED